MVHLLLAMGPLSRELRSYQFVAPRRVVEVDFEREDYTWAIPRFVNRRTVMLARELFDFLEHTADAAFAVTDAGEICSWNSSAEAPFGFERTEAIGRTCYELFQEQRVLRSFSDGQNPSDIDFHHINQKLDTHNRLEAVIHAIRRKLI